MLISLLAALVIGLMAAGFFVAILKVAKKKLAMEASASTSKVIVSIVEVTKQGEAIAKYADSYAPKRVLEKLLADIEATKVSLAKETLTLKAIESKLDTAQKDVEQREAGLQDIKSVREEDEKSLDELLAKFDTMSAESIALEQQLAASLKNLDSIIGEVELTQGQKDVLTDLQASMEEAGGRLRDLITEYQTVTERLKALKAQHQDLEDEYTRLVEQQLGE